MAALDYGMAVLLVSAELDEVMSLADRIAVLYAGRIAGVLASAEATPELLGYMMATGKSPESGEVEVPAEGSVPGR